MLLFEGSYIEVGLVNYTGKFLDAMKNWQKTDYAYYEKKAKELLQENYDYIEKNKKKTSEIDTKEYWYKEYLKQINDAKKGDQERKEAERKLQNILRSLERVTSTVIKSDESDSKISYISLGLKVGHIGYPHFDMERDVLIFEEYQEGEFYEERQRERTILVWINSLYTGYINLRRTDSRPLKLMEWYQKLTNKSFW